MGGGGYCLLCLRHCLMFINDEFLASGIVEKTDFIYSLIILRIMESLMKTHYLHLRIRRNTFSSAAISVMYLVLHNHTWRSITTAVLHIREFTYWKDWRIFKMHGMMLQTTKSTWSISRSRSYWTILRMNMLLKWTIIILIFLLMYVISAHNRYRSYTIRE